MSNLGIMPAAGLGTRLYPFKGAKELLPLGCQFVGGKKRPKLVCQYGLEAMSIAGINEIIVPITPKKITPFTDCLSDEEKFGINISYMVTKHTPSMVDTIKLVLKDHCTERIFFGMPDTCMLPPDCFKQLLQKHLTAKSKLSLGLFRTSEPQKFGMIKVNQRNEVIYHKDKPRDTSAKFMWGIAIWEPCFSEYVLKNAERLPKKQGNELIFGDVMDWFMKDNNTVYGFTIDDGRYYDVGTYDGYRKAIIEL